SRDFVILYQGPYSRKWLQISNFKCNIIESIDKLPERFIIFYWSCMKLVAVQRGFTHLMKCVVNFLANFENVCIDTKGKFANHVLAVFLEKCLKKLCKLLHLEPYEGASNFEKCGDDHTNWKCHQMILHATCKTLERWRCSKFLEKNDRCGLV